MKKGETNLHDNWEECQRKVGKFRYFFSQKEINNEEKLDQIEQLVVGKGFWMSGVGVEQ